MKPLSGHGNKVAINNAYTGWPTEPSVCDIPALLESGKEQIEDIQDRNKAVSVGIDCAEKGEDGHLSPDPFIITKKATVP